MRKSFLYKIMLICIILTFAAVSVIGCTAPQTPGPEVPEPVEEPGTEQPEPAEVKVDIGRYWPMKVGNVWEYEGEGNEYASYTLRVEYEKGNRYQLTRDNGGTVIADIYEVRDDSIVHVFLMGEQYDHKNLLDLENNLEDIIIKTPIEVGSKWVSEDNSYEIIDTKATITVPYGTFDDCLVIKRTYKDGSEEYLHFKEGIGMLQSEFRSGDFKVFSRLKKFVNAEE